MKKHLFRLYNGIITESSTGYNYLAASILENILFPELKPFGKYRIAIVSIITDLTLVAVLLFCISTVFDLKKRLELARFHTASNETTISLLKRRIHSRDSIINSIDFLRLDIFKKTGVSIPERVDESHIMRMTEIAKETGVPLSIYLKVIRMESRFDSTAINKKTGAFGYMQMMPKTFTHYYKRLGLTGGKTAENNLRCGCSLLKQNYDYWYKIKKDVKLSWELSLACYVMGEELPRKLRRVPNSKEVLFYINNILKDETF